MNSFVFASQISQVGMLKLGTQCDIQLKTAFYGSIDIYSLRQFRLDTTTTITAATFTMAKCKDIGPRKFGDT